MLMQYNFQWVHRCVSTRRGCYLFPEKIVSRRVHYGCPGFYTGDPVCTRNWWTPIRSFKFRPWTCFCFHHVPSAFFTVHFRYPLCIWDLAGSVHINFIPCTCLYCNNTNSPLTSWIRSSCHWKPTRMMGFSISSSLNILLTLPGLPDCFSHPSQHYLS